MRQISKQDGALYYVTTMGESTLPTGVYYPTQVRVGDTFVAAFSPISPDNDPPLDINPMVSGLIGEMDDFFTIQEKYDRFHFAHKRGYILYGPAGCGKSAALRLLQEKFINKFKGLVLVWQGGGTISGHYQEIRQNEPDRPILVVCEDIDATIGSFEEEILEFLDGQIGLRNFVLVATTNHLESIPERIKNRPSRIDRLVEIGFPDRAGRQAYLTRLGLTTEESASVLDAVGNSQLSMAALKEVVIGTLCLGYDPKDVVQRLDNPTTNASFSRRSLQDDWG